MRRKYTTTPPLQKKRLGNVNIPEKSFTLLEYIKSIGGTRSSFNLLRSSESRLKISHPHIYHL